jgi:CRP-like cAMP-binding protein
MTDSSILKGMDLFQGLDSAALDAVLKSAQFRRTPKQTLIFSQGTPATTCHALIEGRIKIVQTGPDGEQVLIHFVGPGEMFGTPAVFLRTGYPADAVAITDCVNLQWSAKVMTDSMMKYPRIALNALGIVAARYQEAQHRLCEMAHQTVERRIAHAVLRLVRDAGRPVDHHVEIDIPLLRQDVAELTGTTMYTVSRILNDWKAKGIIKFGRRRIVVRQLHAITAIAEDLSDSAPRRRSAQA